MKLSDRHICVQQGFEMHLLGLLYFYNINIRLITFWPCLHFISSKFEKLIQWIYKEF